MSRLVYVNGLNPKTTEKDLEEFCTRFGNVIECVICPEDDKLTKRSGYVRFASSYSAEKMHRASCDEPFSIDQTTVNVELGCATPRPADEFRRRTLGDPLQKRPDSSLTTYTLLIEGPVTDEEELINYLDSKPSSVRFIETTNKNGEIAKTGAQVTYSNKELVDRILKRNHEKYTIKLITNKTSTKRQFLSDSPLPGKRSKSSHSLYSSITSHLESLTKLTHDLYEENEHLHNDRNVLKQTVREHTDKLKEMESEKSDLVESSNKTHLIARSITDKYKSREEEHRKGLEESNRMVADMETALRTANESLAQAQNEIQRLTSHLTQLETQLHQSTNDYAQLKCKYSEEETAIEQFFAVVKKHLK